MLAVVIPAKDEAGRIGEVLQRALRLPVSLVIPVLNGCTDMTPTLVARNRDRRIKPLTFREPLGYDVPRVAGARVALEAGARGVIFVDGDLTGKLERPLLSLIDRLKRGADLVLCDCYIDTPIPSRDSTASRVYGARLRLNRLLGREDLGPAIPSHGPTAVSRRLLETVSESSVGVPPLMQAEAVRAELRVEVGAALPHLQLGSAQRDRQHSLKIAETIMGDCEMGVCAAEMRALNRAGHVGYHRERRFDLLGLEPPDSEC